MSPQTRHALVMVLTVLGMAVTASLGRWQLDRAGQKEALQAQIEARAAAPVVDARGIQTAPVDELLHRRVHAEGRWVRERTVYLDNRQMFGRPGFFVVTPLRLDDGSVVLVQRGWAPRNFEDRLKVPSVETPKDQVTVEGRLALPPSKLYELGGEERGAIRQNLDLQEFRQETGLALGELTLQQVGEPSEGLSRDWPPINLGVSKHYGYAFQWFGLCALMAILYVWYQIVPRVRARKR